MIDDSITVPFVYYDYSKSGSQKINAEANHACPIAQPQGRDLQPIVPLPNTEEQEKMATTEPAPEAAAAPDQEWPEGTSLPKQVIFATFHPVKTWGAVEKALPLTHSNRPAADVHRCTATSLYFLKRSRWCKPCT